MRKSQIVQKLYEIIECIRMLNFNNNYDDSEIWLFLQKWQFLSLGQISFIDSYWQIFRTPDKLRQS